MKTCRILIFLCTSGAVSFGRKPLGRQTYCQHWCNIQRGLSTNCVFTTGTARIRHQCSKTAILSCHRCLINTALKKWTTFKYRLQLWPPGACVIKLITAVIYGLHNKLERLSLARLSSLVCLWVRPRAYPRVEHLWKVLHWVGSGLTRKH